MRDERVQPFSQLRRRRTRFGFQDSWGLKKLLAEAELDKDMLREIAKGEF